jgi:hypothetical protein
MRRDSAIRGVGVEYIKVTVLKAALALVEICEFCSFCAAGSLLPRASRSRSLRAAGEAGCPGFRPQPAGGTFRSFGPLAGRRYDFYRQGRQYRARERSHLRRSGSASLREIAAGLK